ncbi:ubiquitin conjugating enzyme [Grosmannia clavigera kw1407]|uniref:E2 ubiquitin-conjugating enzyme n=1 Tax=Grosmannia clavigera (strain kw1407 / UAMH 11150) TaxID=655863 RepID=F0XJG3_GROCL|nr:ubiquitin conjugating enzyme [Grosmannia clavigera kw1407]EFX02107.1 ubiquitin conjugating enzyme [Grosmannia clavigera kw1407]
MSSKRIAKEFAECSENAPEGYTIALGGGGSDLHRWNATLSGPADTPYAGGHFGVVITLPTDYPFKAPVVTFASRIYHPNITNDSLGNVCLALLKSENWKPATKLRAVLDAVRQLLVAPQPDDPLEARIADEYRSDRAEFDKQAAAYTENYAKGAPKFS